jgi:hypothetical protein
VSIDPAKCKHPAKFSHGGMTFCVHCGDRIVLSLSEAIRSHMQLEGLCQVAGRLVDDFAEFPGDGIEEDACFNPVPYRFLEGV